MVAENRPQTGLGFTVVSISRMFLICSRKDSSKYLSHSSNITYLTLVSKVVLPSPFPNKLMKLCGVATRMLTPNSLHAPILFFYYSDSSEIHLQVIFYIGFSQEFLRKCLVRLLSYSMIWVDSSCWGATIIDYNPSYPADLTTLLGFFCFFVFYYFAGALSEAQILFFKILCKRGSKYDNVLPVPVGAVTKTFRSSKNAGIVCI